MRCRRRPSCGRAAAARSQLVSTGVGDRPPLVAAQASSRIGKPPGPRQLIDGRGRGTFAGCSRERRRDGCGTAAGLGWAGLDADDEAEAEAERSWRGLVDDDCCLHGDVRAVRALEPVPTATLPLPLPALCSRCLQLFPELAPSFPPICICACLPRASPVCPRAALHHLLRAGAAAASARGAIGRPGCGQHRARPLPGASSRAAAAASARARLRRRVSCLRVNREFFVDPCLPQSQRPSRDQHLDRGSPGAAEPARPALSINSQARDTDASTRCGYARTSSRPWVSAVALRCAMPGPAARWEARRPRRAGSDVRAVDGGAAAMCLLCKPQSRGPGSQSFALRLS